MKFRSRRSEEPEVMLIPMIDVMLVLLIFFVATTTFVRETGVDLELPTIDQAARPNDDRPIVLNIDATGRYALGEHPLAPQTDAALIAALREAKAAAGGNADVRVIISADRNTPHQYVVTALDAAGKAGLGSIGIAALPRDGAAP